MSQVEESMMLGLGLAFEQFLDRLILTLTSSVIGRHVELARYSVA
jgi:hypothetical protein